MGLFIACEQALSDKGKKEPVSTDKISIVQPLSLYTFHFLFLNNENFWFGC